MKKPNTIKLLVVFSIMFLSTIGFLPSLAQSGECPQGTRAEVRGSEVICVSIGGVEGSCPQGTYHGLDNQGNPACRDTSTNQIVDPETGLMVDSQTGEIILDDEQMTYVGIGVVIFIIIIVIIAGASRKTPYKDQARMGFSDSIKEEVLRKQNHRCADCKRILNVLDFDHIDGDKTNDALTNCQALCPNCHAKKSRTERSKYNEDED